MSLNPLATVHDAMIIASDKPNLRPFTVKADNEDLSEAMKICERNGTTLGAFLRKCVECLIDDYVPPKDPQDVKCST